MDTLQVAANGNYGTRQFNNRLGLPTDARFKLIYKRCLNVFPERHLVKTWPTVREPLEMFTKGEMTSFSEGHNRKRVN